ncbi:alpha-1,2-fucosyltransferase [Sphingobacterium hungaricum]
MKIVNFIGGLGNQMFQYAFYLYLIQHHRRVKADLREFEGYPLHNGFELTQIFDIKLKKATSLDINLHDNNKGNYFWRLFRRINGSRKSYQNEKIHFSYDQSIKTDSMSRYYWGYWQNQNYLNPIEPELRKAFIFPKITDNKNADLLSEINRKNTVAVHVRRGDYVNHPSLGNICDLAYYQKAISIMKEKIPNATFVIFSNDQRWCRENLAVDDGIFVDWNTGNESFRDMQLMSACSHQIIANSSFSWWAAWLNPNPKKIIVQPKKWINDSALDTSGLVFKNALEI